MNEILKAEHLYKTYISGRKTISAVKDVSFTLHEGEMVGLAGMSGSGNPQSFIWWPAWRRWIKEISPMHWEED